MLQLERLKNKWHLENASQAILAGDDDIVLFQKRNNVIVPNDLITYFKQLNGTGGDCNDELYEFYAIDRIKNVIKEYEDWEGIPDYRGVFNILNEPEKIFVFANYHFNLFAYAIKLYPKASTSNEIFVICGAEYKKIADSFSEFIELYLNDSIELKL